MELPQFDSESTNNYSNNRSSEALQANMYWNKGSDHRQIWEQNASLQILLEALFDGAIVTDRQGACLKANPAAREMLGRKDFVAAKIKDLAANPEEIDKILQEIAFREEIRTRLALIHANGTCQTVELSVTARFSPDCYLWIFRETAMASFPSVVSSATLPVNVEEKRQIQHIALDACANSIIITDCQGTIEWVNQGFTKLNGYQAEDAIGKNMSQLVKSGKQDRAFYQNLWQTILAGEVWQGEMVNQRQDGSYYPQEMTITPVFSDSGDMTHFIAIQQDLSDRKQIEAALQEREACYRRIVETILEGIWQLDANCQITFANTTMAAMLGYRVDEMVGFSLFEFMDAQWQAVAEEKIERRRQGISEQFEFQLQHRDGSKLWVLVSTNPIFDEEGNFAGSLAAVADISDRHAMEAALREREERLKNITANLPGAIFRYILHTDGSDRVIYMSDGCEDLWEVDAERVQESADVLWDLVHPADLDAIKQSVIASARTLEPWFWEWRIITPSGRCKWLYGAGRPKRQSNGDTVWDTLMLDISDRKRIEFALIESETRYRTLLENIPGVVYRCFLDEYWTMLFLSQEIQTISGYPASDFYNNQVRSFISIIHPEDRTKVREGIMQGVQSRQPYRLEYRLLRADGQERWVYEKGQGFWDERGQLQYLDGVFFDITERKRTEASLQQVNQQLQALLDYCPTPLNIFDGNGYYHRVNQETVRLLGKSSEAEIKGRHFGDFLPADLVDVFMVRIRQLVETGEPVTVEDRIWRNGKERFFNSILFPIASEEGAPKLFGSIATEVTDNVLAKRALQEREQKFRALAENSPDCILRLDREFRYLYVNPKAAEVIGIPAADFLGKTDQELGVSEALIQLWHTSFHRAIATKQEETIEFEFPTPQGNIEFYSRIVPELDADGCVQSLLVVGRDVSQIKQVQRTLQRQAQQERLQRTIAEQIRQTLNLDEILNTTVTQVRTILQADRATIYRFYDDAGGEIVFESVIEPWKSSLRRKIRDPYLENDLIERYRQGCTCQIADIYNENLTQCHIDLLAQFEIRANLVVPIICEERLWGLLCVNQCQVPRQWQSWEVELLVQLTTQVAIAIQQSQLLERTSYQAQREQLLNRIVTAMRNSLDLEEILQPATDEMLQAFQASYTMVALCDESDRDFTYTTVAAAEGLSINFQKEIPIAGNPYVEQVLSQEKAVAIDDMSVEFLPDSIAQIVADLQLRSLLAVAIRYEGKVKGVLGVHQCDRVRRWSEDEKLLIEQIADQLAIAIQQSELYQQAQTELERRQEIAAQLRYDALHDALTGLPNRTLLMDRLHHALQHSLRENYANPAQNHPQFAILFLDLNRFKAINDSLGHKAGDCLLQTVAERLSSCLRETDTVARLGGDEFILLLENIHDTNDVIEIVTRIHQILQTPTFLEGHEVAMSTSVGIVMGVPGYQHPEELLRDADNAMYRAKKHKLPYALFDTSMHTIALQQMQLENDLRRAIERQELRLYYQPIVSLQTQKVLGFEALVRWYHSQQGFISPVDFIPIAEDTGLILDIDAWVWRQACQQLQRWQNQFPHLQDLYVSVNVSGKHFSNDSLVTSLSRFLDEFQIADGRLKVEITESVLIENAQVATEILQQLQARKIPICLDDFGTGYSSLSYLHRFPIDVLKIDRSFLGKSHNIDLHNREIVKAIVNLGWNLNIKAIAEGIETEEHVNFLREHSCQVGQGYYFSRPLDARSATELLAWQTEDSWEEV